MTVCIAALFNWNYTTTPGGANLGPAALVVTDRMITAGDVQYEPAQTKMAHITYRVLLVIAGDYSIHSQAIKIAMEHFRNKQNATPESVAALYGRTLQALKLKEAEDLYLAPLGLNSDSFLAQQKDMAPHFVSQLTDQMQSYRGEETETLVIGGSADRVDIYGVDTKGIVACYNDVGFAAIGSGAWHARSRLMQAGYVNTTTFSAALSIVFAAKKVAELAPGVGSNTDIALVFTGGHQPLRIDVANKVHELYQEYMPKLNALGIEYINKVQEYISKPSAQAADEEPKGVPGGSAQTNENASQPAAETPRQNEAGKA
jgi:20S proteasome alpha/beta subunit